MDMAREEVRNLNYNEFTETKSLDHASQQARQRNYQDFLIVDVDSHHYENEHYKEVYGYIESPVIKMEAVESIARGGRSAFLNSQVGYQGLSGRITRHNLRKQYKAKGEHHRDIEITKDGKKHEMDCKEDGTIVDIQNEIGAKDLPAAAVSAIKAKHPGSTIKEVGEILVAKDGIEAKCRTENT